MVRVVEIKITRQTQSRFLDRMSLYVINPTIKGTNKIDMLLKKNSTVSFINDSFIIPNASKIVNKISPRTAGGNTILVILIIKTLI